MKILQYRVKVGDFSVDMPEGAEIRDLQKDVIGNYFTIFALADPNKSAEKRHFTCIPIDKKYDPTGYQFIGTMQCYIDDMLVHCGLFEKINK